MSVPRYNSWHDVLHGPGNGVGVEWGDRLTANQRRADELVLNEMTMRLEWMRGLTDPMRNVDKECGWPERITPQEYWRLFRRDPLANRAGRLACEESWREGVRIYEDEDPAVETEFEAAVKGLGASLNADGDSWHEEEEGSLFLESCLRADILSGLGTYGVVVVGIDDGRDLAEPARMRRRPKGRGGAADPGLTANASTGQTRELLYLCPLPEAQCPVDSFDVDPSSPRFRRPNFYNVTFEDPQTQPAVGSTAPTNTYRVHWSRVVHLAPGRLASEVFAQPGLEAVYNTILDGRKIYGAMGEGYWLSAFAGMFFKGGPGQRVNVEAVKASYEQYRWGLQRSLVGQNGVEATPLNPSMVDPTPYIDKVIEAVCIQKDIPVRIFKGSERGELASSQDEQDWLASIKGRQSKYLTPRMVAPLISRFIALGCLPVPRQFCVAWPSLFEPAPDQKAKTFLTRVQAWGTWKSTGLEESIPMRELAAGFDDLTDEEADQLVQAREEAQQDVLDHQQLMEQANIDLQQQQIDAGVVADPTALPPGQEQGFPVGNEGPAGGMTDAELVAWVTTADAGGLDDEVGPAEVAALVKDLEARL